MMPGRDLFLSHAYADKHEYVYPLAEALSRRGVSCWIDEAQIFPGDSVIAAINEGLGSARYVLVLITSNFLEREFPERELNAALSREIRTGSVVVLPVLATDRDEYFRRYPLLADKLYLDWTEGPEVLADKIAARFGRHPSPEWHCAHPSDYVGLIWIRVLPQPGHVGENHTITLRWGPYIKVVGFIPESEQPSSFVHHKTNQDDILLHVTVDPPSIVTFGQGKAPDRDADNIDEGWTRTAGGHWPGHL